MDQPVKRQNSDPFRNSLRISLIYFIVSSLWIIISDLLNVAYHNDSYGEFVIEAGKGLLFVLISSVIIFLLLRRHFAAEEKSKQEIFERESEYRSLTERLKVGIIRGTPEGKYLFMNNSAREIMKDYFRIKPDEEIAGLTPEQVYLDRELVERVYKTIGHIIKTGESLTSKAVYGSRNVSVYSYPEINEKGEVTSLLSILTDETEAVKNMRQLEESEKFNSRLLESSYVIVYIFDLESRSNIYINKAIERLLGYSKDEIKEFGENLLKELMHPDDVGRFANYLQEQVYKLADGEESGYEYRMRHKKGYYCWFRGHDCIYKRNNSGKPVQILGSAINISDLKNTQEEVRKNSDYLNSIIEVSPTAVYNLDPEGRVINIWNKSAENMFGWKAEEVFGKRLPIISKEKDEEFDRYIGLLNRGESINGVEFLRRRKDGSPVNIRVHARPMPGKSGKVESILAYGEDITIEKNFAEAKQRNEEYLKTLYDASLAANRVIETSELYRVCFGFIKNIIDVTGIMVSLVTEDGKFIKYDALWLNGENIDPSNIPLMKLDPVGSGPLTRTILTGEAQVVNDLEEQTKNSVYKFFVDEDGNLSEPGGEVKNVSHAAIMIPLKHAEKVIGVLQVQNFQTGIFNNSDILKLEPFAFIFASAIQRAKLYKKLQSELTEKDAAFEQLRKFSKGIEQSPNSIVITNAEYEIEYVNPYFTELTGYSFEEVLGKNPSVLKSGQTEMNVYRNLRESLSRGETWHGEFLNLKKNGELYWEAASIGPITDNEGKVTHYIAIKQDITEKKKKDKELKDSLEEKEIMLKEIHHRVKNNLQVISSLLNMQVEQYEHPEAIEAINSSRNRVKAMALVHENLYQSESIGKTSLREYLIMLAKNIYSSYGVSFERVKFYCETNGIEFGLDTIIPLGLILNEGISNSLKHAFPGNAKGEINVVLENSSENDIDLLNKTEGIGSYNLKIKDNGKGLPVDFDPERTNSLGMTLLNSLAAQLDGEAVINNKVGTEIIINFKELKYKNRV